MKYYNQVDWRGHKFSGGSSLSGQKTITNPSAWIDQHVYATASEVIPFQEAQTGFKYVALTGGESDHDTNEPTWPTTVGATVSDEHDTNGEIIWECRSMAAQIVSTSTPCSKVIVKALGTNGGLVYIGNSGLEATTDGYPLAASESTPPLEVDNLNKLYAIVASSTDGVSYIGSN